MIWLIVSKQVLADILPRAALRRGEERGEKNFGHVAARLAQIIAAVHVYCSNLDACAHRERCFGGLVALRLTVSASSFLLRVFERVRTRRLSCPGAPALPRPLRRQVPPHRCLSSLTAYRPSRLTSINGSAARNQVQDQTGGSGEQIVCAHGSFPWSI